MGRGLIKKCHPLEDFWLTNDLARKEKSLLYKFRTAVSVFSSFAGNSVVKDKNIVLC